MKHYGRGSRTAWLVVLALILALLAGCSGGQNSDTQQNDAPAASVDEELPAGPSEGEPEDEPEADGPQDAGQEGEEPGDTQPEEAPPEDGEPEEAGQEPPASGTEEPASPMSGGAEPEGGEPAGTQPAEPAPEEEDPADAPLEDGNYTASVTLEGGTGRASVESPAKLRCENGQFWATIVWSSSNYDYMKVDGVRYELVNTEGNSTFEIPVAAFDQKLPVIADTVAMSEPHEVEYTLLFDSSTLTKE